MSFPAPHLITVIPDWSGQRLDRVLSLALHDLTRSQAGLLTRQGLVRVEGDPKKASYCVKAGESIEVLVPSHAPARLLPEPMALSLLFEDEHLLVVNKQPGVIVHPGAGHSAGTLMHGLLFMRPELAFLSAGGRPGLVHRLDKMTSGALLVAKTLAVQAALQAQFKTRTVEKIYLTLVLGHLRSASGQVALPIGRHAVQRQRMSVRQSGGRHALTRWWVLERLRGASLLRVQIHTGRTHQIRVHLAAEGHPVLGDTLYGNPGVELRQLRGAIGSEILTERISRQMLHAWRLSFHHPVSGQKITVEAPIPEDLRSWIERLREPGQVIDSVLNHAFEGQEGQ